MQIMISADTEALLIHLPSAPACFLVRPCPFPLQKVATFLWEVSGTAANFLQFALLNYTVLVRDVLWQPLWCELRS